MRRVWLVAFFVLGYGCGDSGGSGPPGAADVSGPWVPYDDGDVFVMAVRFDGAGTWEPVMFDPEPGTYSVAADGTVALLHSVLGTNVGVLNGARDRIDLVSGAPGYMRKVQDAGALAGTWEGTIVSTLVTSTLQG